MTTTTTWTYDGYWHAVLGSVSPLALVAEHCLVADGLDGWLGKAETEAWAQGGDPGPLPEEWAGFHARALAELMRAVEVQS